MTHNPYLKIFVANGLLRHATPYLATRYTFDHMGLPPNLQTNVSMGYYEAGHMMYVNQPSLVELKKTWLRFIHSALPAKIINFVRLLDRYLLRELLVPLAYCLARFLDVLHRVRFDLDNRPHPASALPRCGRVLHCHTAGKSWWNGCPQSRSCWPPLRADQSQPLQ